MATETNLTLLVVGLVAGMVTALVPVFLAAIAAYLKLAEIDRETKEQTQKIDAAAIARVSIAAKTNEKLVGLSASKIEPQPVLVKNIDPVPVDVKNDDEAGK